ncbi:MAG: (2Fe-2S) ferredoxin domain-containing protein [Actinomycetia bacterium]|nr:(2Fe-2S) ferredoxin domain-containing protein [Actinomycetes bacterium]
MSAPDVSRFRRRVLVCQGEICRARGAGAVLAAWLRRAAAVDAVVLRSGCLALCRLGPVVVVYPEGAWLGGQTPRRVAETVRLGRAGHWDMCPGLIPAIE